MREKIIEKMSIFKDEIGRLINKRQEIILNVEQIEKRIIELQGAYNAFGELIKDDEENKKDKEIK